VNDPLAARQAGVLLHPSSLPGAHGIGDLGASARAYVDWLASAGMKVWQILPLGPTGPSNCPYVSWAARAGNPWLIDLVALRDHRLIDELPEAVPETARIDHGAVIDRKKPYVYRAAERLLSDRAHPLHRELERFRAEATWAKNAAVFAALRARHGGRAFWEWDQDFRARRPAAMASAERELAAEIDREIAVQLLFEDQWRALRRYAGEKKILLFGDVPIYVDRDSSDVWENQDQFQLDEQGLPEVVAGVPPDYFSETGQHWGNPLYRWDVMAEDDYAWWRARLARQLEQTDIVRIDHFRALSAYWEIPKDAPDARGGRWVKGPGIDFFRRLRHHLGELPLVAEDLGTIDEDVHRLREQAGLPGMRVLHFAFDGSPHNPHLPRNHTEDGVCYPGTHDNDTTLGWWQALDAHTRALVTRELGARSTSIVWDMIDAAFASKCRLAVVAMQDVLELDGDSRMNDPGRPDGNWEWKMIAPPPADAAEKLHALAARHLRMTNR
jgi:4-alpha-glucanotransferase